MKLMVKLGLINLLGSLAFTAVADDTYGPSMNSNMQELINSLNNLGSYLGYDLTGKITTPPSPPNQQLLSMPWPTLTQNYLYVTFLGAIPVNAISQTISQFVPTTGAYINQFANKSFPNYGSPDGQAAVSAQPPVDQPTAPSSSGDSGSFLPDPVSQAVFNILGTPDYSYCLKDDGTGLKDNCSSQNAVMSGLLGGSLPKIDQFFTYGYNQPVIGQLNSNSLTGPLLYSIQSSQPPSTGSPIPGRLGKTAPTTTPQTQAQQAASFIRYASGLAAPISLPSYSSYKSMLETASAKQGDANYNVTNTLQAQNVLNAYFTNLRVYAAQSSVGISNLYYILSKRLPQNLTDSNPTSQALTEFNMATWRLFNPANAKDESKQWVVQISAASPASVQKEIAVLLAEINYQMYLDRQIQERILLTNSIMLMQNLKASQPSAEFASQAGSDQ